jgi:hypothetical protein
MKRIVNSIVCLTFLITQSHASSSSKSCRNIAFFFDFSKSIAHKKEADDVTLHFMTALLQQASVIVVSDTIWNDFAKRKNNFIKKALTLNTAEYEYQQSLNAIINKLNESSSASHNDLKKALDSLQSDPIIKTIKTDFQLNERDILCYALPFNPSEWDVYELSLPTSSSFYVLIPSTYKTTLKITSNSNNSIAQATLGLKTTTLKPVTLVSQKISNAPQSLLQSPKELPLISTGLTQKENISDAYKHIMAIPALHMTQLLSSLFIEKSPYKWNVYIMGHGQALDDKIYRHIELLWNKIQKLQEEEKTAPAPRITNIAQEIAQYQKEINNLLQPTDNITTSIALVANMALPQFKAFLQFLNNEITTNFLFVVSRYSSERNAKLGFFIDGYPDIYNFPIATVGNTDLPTKATLLDFPSLETLIRNPQIIEKASEYIAVNKQEKIEIIWESLINFNAFYDALCNRFDKPLAYDIIVNKVNPFLKNSSRNAQNKIGDFTLSNIPNIRFPGTSWFSEIRLTEIDNSISRITRVIVNASLLEKKKIDITTKQAVLLYTPYIPLTLTTQEILPSIMPMTTDQSLYIKELQAPKTPIDVAINKFIRGSFTQTHSDEISLETPKLFCIDDFHVLNTMNFIEPKNAPVILNNALIFFKMPYPLATAGNVNNKTRKFLEESLSTGIIFSYQGKAYMWLYLSNVLLQRPLNTKETKAYEEYYNIHKNAAEKTSYTIR